VSLKIPRGAAMRPVAGSEDVRVRLEELSDEKHRLVMRELMASVDRPGWSRRETQALEDGMFQDPEMWREGFENMRIAVAERDGQVTGFARFRRKLDWNAEGPAGRVQVFHYV